MKLIIERGQVSIDVMGRLAPDEARDVAELSARDDTQTLLVQDGERIVGYAVFGQDAHDMLTIYAARSLNHHLTKMALQAFFGVAQILGQPLRIHAERLRRHPMARMMGAHTVFAGADADGVPMGVFCE